MELTKELAIELHRELWDWLAHNPERDKDDWPEMGKYEKLFLGVKHDCFLCEYNMQAYDDSDCRHGCLVKWPKTLRKSYPCEDSLWRRFRNSNSSIEERAILAGKIRDLPLIEDLELTNDGITISSLWDTVVEEGHIYVCRSCAYRHFNMEGYEIVNHDVPYEAVCEMNGCSGESECTIYPKLTMSIALKILDEEARDYNTGYHNGKNFFIFDGWDEVNRVGKRIIDMFTDHEYRDSTEALEYLIETLTGDSSNWGFSDEYIVCNNCDEVIHLHHDHYWHDEDGRYCQDCVRSEFEEEFIQYLINEPHRCNFLLKNDTFERYGFTALDEEYANGFYYSHDNPEKVMEKLRAKYNEVIFSSTSNNPFEVTWIAFVKGTK